MKISRKKVLKLDFEILIMYYVFKLPIFDKKATRLLSKGELFELEKIINQLKINPNIGKILTYSFLREKKVGSKRIYFLVYKEICLILLVSASDKKSQQKTINEIKKYLEEYKEYAYELYRNISNE